MWLSALMSKLIIELQVQDFAEQCFPWLIMSLYLKTTQTDRQSFVVEYSMVRIKDKGYNRLY